MSRLVNVRLWPLAIASVLLLLAAAINVQSLLVPNWLTMPSILAAWLAAALVSARMLPARGGGFGPSLLLTFFGGMLLALPYGYGWLGAGCVKMQMALGAWIGCTYSAERGAKVVIAATIVGALVSIAGFAVHAALIAGDAKSVDWPLFPAQVTLSLGAIAVLLAIPLVIEQDAPDTGLPSSASEPGGSIWATRN